MSISSNENSQVNLGKTVNRPFFSLSEMIHYRYVLFLEFLKDI